MTILDDLNLGVRDVRMSDALALTTILNSYIATHIATLETQAQAVSSVEDKIRDIADFGGPFVVLENLEGGIVGFAYGGRYRPKSGYGSSIELTIYLVSSLTGKGVGKLLLPMLVDQCRARGFKLAVSVITVDPVIGATNMPSGKLHLACGFDYVGTMPNVAKKFGRFWDTATFVLDLNPAQLTP